MLKFLTKSIINRIGQLESFYEFSQETLDYHISTKKLKQLGLNPKQTRENIPFFLDEWEYY
jgi:hypothetical protein